MAKRQYAYVVEWDNELDYEDHAWGIHSIHLNRKEANKEIALAREAEQKNENHLHKHSFEIRRYPIGGVELKKAKKAARKNKTGNTR